MYLSYAVVILTSFVFSSPAAVAAKKNDPEFVDGYIGGKCGTIGPQTRLCLNGICTCGAGYKSHIVIGMPDTIGCFGKPGEPCVPGNVALVAFPFLTNKSHFVEKLSNATAEYNNAKGTVYEGKFKKQLDALELINKTGMGGKSAEHWSCISGMCVNETWKCSPEKDANYKLLEFVDIPKGVKNETDIDRGGPRSVPASIPWILALAGLPILYTLIRPPLFSA